MASESPAKELYYSSHNRFCIGMIPQGGDIPDDHSGPSSMNGRIATEKNPRPETQRPGLTRRFSAVNKRCARAANAQLLHPKLKCGALNSKAISRSVGPGNKPITGLEGAQDLSPLGLL